jgi:hypothetical protein
MVWSHTIKPKEVLKPLNEAEVRPSGFKGFFYLIIIIIMAKIILHDGVINVKESYQEIKELIFTNDWLQLTTENQELKMMEMATGNKQDYRVLIQIKHIQCIKP